jgi:putative hydrolase of the HAD superfamily
MIKHLLFDLGGVLLNLDQQRTHQAFADLVGDAQAHRAMYDALLAERVFERFETNELDEQGFIQAMQGQHPLAGEAIERAWSAMLLDLPAERLMLLEQLRREGYRLFLLSNINSIHLRNVQAILRAQYGSSFDLDRYFDQAFYSHLIGRRKPQASTYAWVLEQMQAAAAHTAFFDDLHENILGAQKIGLRAVLHPSNGDIAQTVYKTLSMANGQDKLS